MGEHYPHWTAVSQAMKAIAQVEFRTGTNRHDVSARLEAARLDRFLCRVFAEDERSEWLLKGGSALLARFSDARATRDLDLLASSSRDLDEARDALVAIGARDLGDHLRFDLVDEVSGHAGNQADIRLRGLVFVAVDRDTERVLGRVPIDVVIAAPPVGTIELIEPSNRLYLPRPLVSSPYRIFPLADHVADKIAATLSRYHGGRESTRVKDLVDLVAIAATQQLDFAELRLAIHARRVVYDIAAERLTVPEPWRVQYPVMARKNAVTRGRTDFDTAVALARDLVDPALRDDPLPPGTTWIPGVGWTRAPDAPPHSASNAT